MNLKLLLLYASCLTLALNVMGRTAKSKLYSIQADAKDKLTRTRIANAGIAIDAVLEDKVGFIGTELEMAALRKLGISFESSPLPERRGFPPEDALYHDFGETVGELKRIAEKYPALVTLTTIGQSVEGKAIYGVRLSSAPESDSQPTAIFMGCHHAREHLSVEVPLLLAIYLAENYATNSRIQSLLDTREVWIIPMVNPDGAEYDVNGGQYRYWRKNRRPNGGGSVGVDLNRNYGRFWGGPGSSGDPNSDIYRGASEFSEPETRAVRDFVRARKKATVLLTFHTFSELILWPWGHTDDAVPNEKDRQVFETMGRKMAEWNHYTPEKGSDLYLASGDTTDWAYDELNLFAFTFELTPNSIFSGGFYPGAGAIVPTFKANIEPALYLIENAENPYSVLDNTEREFNLLGDL